jgi:predicted dienelactone hydrolase
VPFTTTSVVSGAPRVLDTVIWYPTAASGPIDPGTGAVADAPLDPSGGPHPLLVFSHGGCGLPNGGKYLMPLLASHGFVVAAPPHPGSTFFDYPTCFTTAAVIESALERPADVSFVLDALLAATADPASPFFGAIDGARAGIAGHSFGGYTVAAAVAGDARFRVAVLLAPAVSEALPPVGIPSLTMLGEVDSVGAVAGFDTDNGERRQAWEAASPPKLLVEILDAGHFAFSDVCFPGLSAVDCNFPVTLSQDEAHALVRRWVLPFLQRYLRGDAAYEPFLAEPPPAGVLVERVT